MRPGLGPSGKDLLHTNPYLSCRLRSREDEGLMIQPHQPTTAQIRELIENLDRVMDAFSMSNDNVLTRNKETYSFPYTDISRNLYQNLFGEIWEGFLLYCHQNELDPAQQIRETVASHYQDLLKTYRIRKTLSLCEEAELI